jgi:hypothetical protein
MVPSIEGISERFKVISMVDSPEPRNDDTGSLGPIIFTVTLLKNGDCEVTQSTFSRDLRPPVVLHRTALENYFRGIVLVRGTLEDMLKDLDRVGIVEFTAFE